MPTPIHDVTFRPASKRCKCVRCGAPLPILHSADHLCEQCFDEKLTDLLQWLDELLKEAENGDKEADQTTK